MLSSAAIKQRAAEFGFDLCGISPAHAFPELAFLAEWLARGYAGEMDYLTKSADVRADIRNFLPSARSVIVMGTNYNSEQSAYGAYGAKGATGDDRAKDGIKVARYARGQDYHTVIEDRLLALVAWMRDRAPDGFEAAHFVDKHQVQERVFAHYAGIGWIGKNTCVINPDVGSWLFLSGIATNLDLQPDAPAVDQAFLEQDRLIAQDDRLGRDVDARHRRAPFRLLFLAAHLSGCSPA